LPLKNLDVLIVDDEPLSCTRIRRMLSSDPLIADVRVSHDGKQALEMIHEFPPDLLILDIEMPGLNGFGILNEMTESERPAVIFVTAYEEYAVRAFEFSAVDYLLKPFSRLRFHQAMEKARKELVARRGSESTAFRQDRLAIRIDGEVQFVRTAEVDWIEAEGRYSRLHLGRRSVLMRESISRLAMKLNAQKFVRIHRSYIVSIDRIQKMQPIFHGDYRLTLQDGTKLVMSRNYRSALSQLMGDSR
jgi:two-component system, LytTR family, response regulator